MYKRPGEPSTISVHFEIGTTMNFFKPKKNVFLELLEEIDKRQKKLPFPCLVSIEKQTGYDNLTITFTHWHEKRQMILQRTIGRFELDRTRLGMERYLDLFFHALEEQRLHLVDTSHE